MRERERVVILGAGFGGLMTAIHLAKRTSKKAVDIVVIDKSDEHVYTPWLYRVPADVLSGRTSSAARNCHFTFKEILAPFADRIEFRNAEVSSVNVETSYVLLTNGSTVQYDYLVVALGSETAYYGIERT